MQSIKNWKKLKLLMLFERHNDLAHFECDSQWYSLKLVLLVAQV